MDDQDFLRLLDDYLYPHADPNPGMAEVKIVWERDNPDLGARHILEKHHVTEWEVEEVLLEIPPYVEARKHRDHPNRTVFWGATRFKRWLVVICEDWIDSQIRFLKPITAFEPEEGIDYWEGYK